jgi:hypothetical protein
MCCSGITSWAVARAQRTTFFRNVRIEQRKQRNLLALFLQQPCHFYGNDASHTKPAKKVGTF